jgi:hypothetical protein
MGFRGQACRNNTTPTAADEHARALRQQGARGQACRNNSGLIGLGLGLPSMVRAQSWQLAQAGCVGPRHGAMLPSQRRGRRGGAAQRGGQATLGVTLGVTLSRHTCSASTTSGSSLFFMCDLRRPGGRRRLGLLGRTSVSLGPCPPASAPCVCMRVRVCVYVRSRHAHHAWNCWLMHTRPRKAADHAFQPIGAKGHSASSAAAGTDAGLNTCAGRVKGGEGERRGG